MHSDIKRGLAMLNAVDHYGINHPLNPGNARAAVLFAEVHAAAVEIRAMGGAQDAGRSGMLSGAAQRQFFAAEMRKLMRQIARVAKFLDAAAYPAERQKLMVPRSNGYQALITRAEVFLETLGPIRTEFIDRGMPANFDVQLRDLLQAFASATKQKHSGRVRQVANTAGMKARLREAVRAVRELDVIHSLLLQNDPAEYASWRSASHIERAPRRSDKAGVDQNATLAAANRSTSDSENRPPAERLQPGATASDVRVTETESSA